MFTTLAVLFLLFAADGLFRGRTLNDDWTGAGAEKGRPRTVRWVMIAVWGALAIISFIIGSRFEW